LGLGGDVGQLTDEEQGKDAKNDPAGFVCHCSFHHHQNVILSYFYYLNLLCYTLTIILFKYIVQFYLMEKLSKRKNNLHANKESKKEKNLQCRKNSPIVSGAS
jgi:hypothetical protein